MAFVSEVEPKTAVDALEDHNWINAMYEELNQFARNEVWSLVPRTKQMNVIGTKWVFKNKLDEQGIIVRNKISFVVKGYNSLALGVARRFDEVNNMMEFWTIAWVDHLKTLWSLVGFGLELRLCVWVPSFDLKSLLHDSFT